MRRSLRIAQVDRTIGPANSARRWRQPPQGGGQALARSDHQRFRDLALTGRNHGCDRARLGAVALRIAGVSTFAPAKMRPDAARTAAPTRKFE